MAGGLVVGSAGYLFAVRPRDPTAMAIAVVVLAAVGVFAARIDPAVTLRCE